MSAKPLVRVELALAEGILGRHPLAQKEAQVAGLVVAVLGAHQKVYLLRVEFAVHFVEEPAGDAEACRGDGVEVLENHLVELCWKVGIWIFSCDGVRN